MTYIVHPTSQAQMERDAANAKAAESKAGAEAKAKGAAAPAPRPAVIVPPQAMTGDRQVIDLGDGMEVAGRCSSAGPTPAATSRSTCPRARSCS